MNSLILISLVLVVSYLIYEVIKLKSQTKDNNEHVNQAFSTLGSLVHKQVKSKVESYLHKSDKVYHNWNLGFDRRSNQWKVLARFDDNSGSLLLSQEVLDLNSILVSEVADETT